MLLTFSVIKCRRASATLEKRHPREKKMNEIKNLDVTKRLEGWEALNPTQLLHQSWLVLFQGIIEGGFGWFSWTQRCLIEFPHFVLWSFFCSDLWVGLRVDSLSELFNDGCYLGSLLYNFWSHVVNKCCCFWWRRMKMCRWEEQWQRSLHQTWTHLLEIAQTNE